MIEKTPTKEDLNKAFGKILHSHPIISLQVPGRKLFLPSTNLRIVFLDKDSFDMWQTCRLHKFL